LSDAPNCGVTLDTVMIVTDASRDFNYNHIHVYCIGRVATIVNYTARGVINGCNIFICLRYWPQVTYKENGQARNVFIVLEPMS